MKYQQLIYPLYDDFDKDFFKKVLHAYENNFVFHGSESEKVYFIKSLLCFQMINDYRKPLLSIDKFLAKETNIMKINEEIRNLNFKVDYSWAIWKRDIIMGELAEILMNLSSSIVGTDEEFNEFVYRYLISIWLIDWEGPLFGLLSFTKDGVFDLKEMNEILTLWDFTNIFSKPR